MLRHHYRASIALSLAALSACSTTASSDRAQADSEVVVQAADVTGPSGQPDTAGTRSPSPSTTTTTSIPVPTTVLELRRSATFRYLTRPDGESNRIYASTDDRLGVTASKRNPAQSNVRGVMTFDDVDTSKTHWACANVTHLGGNTQEGIALRVSVDGDRTRAITVTKNIVYGEFGVYNVHLWDSDDETLGGETLPAEQLGSIDLRDEFGAHDSHEGPRRLCAGVEGHTLYVNVTEPTAMTPDWTDGDATRSIKLPTEWVYPGKPGWYIGHLPGGLNATFSELRWGRDAKW